MASSFTSEKLMETVCFPFEDKKWFEKLFVLCSMIVGTILIFPVLFLQGYLYEIQRRIIVDGEKPSMPEWDDFGTLFKNGLKMYGVGFVYSLPYKVLHLIVVGLMLVLFIAGTDFPYDISVFMIGMPLISLLVSIPGIVCMVISFLGVVGQGHMIAQNEFKAAFRFSEVWQIFRSNIGGYLLTYLLLYALVYVTMMVFQFLGMTIILLIAVPFVMILFSAFYSLIYTVLVAQQYLDGRTTAGS